MINPEYMRNMTISKSAQFRLLNKVIKTNIDGGSIRI